MRHLVATPGKAMVEGGGAWIGTNQVPREKEKNCAAA